MATTQTPQPTLTRFDGAAGPRIVGPRDGKAVDLGSLGVRFMIWGEESGGGVSLVEHPIPARTLVAPLHRHSREDEYSYVLEGRMGAQLGDDVVFAEPGEVLGNGVSDFPVRYAIEFQPESVARLCADHGLLFPAAPSPAARPVAQAQRKL